MFKDSQVTHLDAWSLVEEADALPAIGYPAFVGTGKLGVGLDAAGLQSLPDRLCAHYHCWAEPWQLTQTDLYVLREGMISAHLWKDEAHLFGIPDDDQRMTSHVQRNFLPMGYLDQRFMYAGKDYAGDGVRAVASDWRREWSLKDATVRTSYTLDPNRSHNRRPLPRISVEAFAPAGGETLYLHLMRSAAAVGEGDFTWEVALRLQTRHGLAIFAPDDVQAGGHTLLAAIDEGSRYAPAESYRVVYGIAADGAEVALTEDGWTVTLHGPVTEAREAWVRVDFRRFAGDEIDAVPACRDALEAELTGFSRTDFTQELTIHRKDFDKFWGRTADVQVKDGDEYEERRRFMLHMCEYLMRCGNEHALGGTVQFLLNHMNGWKACNFHDHHYIIDGIARANLWVEAEGHAYWMKRVMRPEGRPFPWMMTYDGFPPVPPKEDRAPMSDANRALLAMRLYELGGTGREALLSEVVYPILRAVADHGLAEWFYEEDGKVLFHAVENDVMNETPRVSEAGTVIMYLTVLRKAIAYSEQLGVDADRRTAWQRIVDHVVVEQVDGRYRAWKDAPDTQAASVWFENGFYIAEAQAYLDADAYRRTRDYGQRQSVCNLAWLNAAAASSEIRLGRPDRAEQFLADSLEHRIHGSGYFEECSPVGLAALPPFATAHGAHLTACCEQIVLPDFWAPRVYIGHGLPSRLRNRTVRFSNLRAQGGLLISGESMPRKLTVELHHTGDPLDVELVLRLPAGIGTHFTVLRDGTPAEHIFAGTEVIVPLKLKTEERTSITVEG